MRDHFCDAEEEPCNYSNSKLSRGEFLVPPTVALLEPLLPADLLPLPGSSNKYTMRNAELACGQW